MLRHVVAFVFLALCVSSCARFHGSARNERRATKRMYEQGARAAALQWLELLDDKQYEEAYDLEPARLRASGSAAQFVRSLNARRGPFGRTLSRKFIGAGFTTKLTGAPDGEYESVLFKTSFQHKALAAERLILSRERGTWRVVDYRLY